MKRKEINARVISKHDTPTEWKMATDFIPEQGEIIIYDETNEIGTSKIKIGDGKRNINDLPFAAEPEKYVIKEAGKGLSTNDFTNQHKEAVDEMVKYIENSGEMPQFTDTKYFAGTGLGLSDNIFYNAGVVDINLQPHTNGDEPTYSEIVITKVNSEPIILKQPSYLLNDNFQTSTKPGVFEIKYYFQPSDGTEGRVKTREIQIEGCYSEESIRNLISEQINEIPGVVSEIFIYNSTDEEFESPTGQPLVIDSGTQTLYYRPDADSGLNTLFSKEMLDKTIMITEEELLPYDEENDTGLLAYDYIKLQIKPTSGKILYKDENNNLIPLILKDYLPITGGNQGTNVTVTPVLTSGEKIATITIDDVQNNLYVKSCLPITGGTLTGDLILQRNTSDPTKSYRINAAYADLDEINSNSIEATNITASGEIVGDKVYGAVWNDYAEYRATNTYEPGRVICETGEGSLVLTTERLMPGCEIISDTFGFSIGKTEENNTPVAIAGRVLAYTYEPRETFVAGEPVCSGPNGTVSKMTREEVKEYPDRIIGTVSEIPSYETWGSGNVPVNNRIWIRIR